MKVFKANQTVLVGKVVLISSCFLVILLMYHLYSSSQHLNSVKRSTIYQPSIKEEISTIKSDGNTIKSDGNKIKSKVKTIKPVLNVFDFGENVKTDKNDSYPVQIEKKELPRSSWISPPKGTLLSRRQIAAITKALPKSGNLLVWGLGNDSPFWHYSTKGKVIFIEPEGFWLNKIISRYPFLETYPVNYTTLLFESFDKYINNSKIWSDLDLRPQLPPVVTQTPWDVIIVDAPLGYGANNPGRYQSIYTSSLIAQSQNGTHIFVDDFGRKVERQYSLKMLGVPVEVVNRDEVTNSTSGNNLAHFYHIRAKL